MIRWSFYMNVFRKCLRKEFGKNKYMDYVKMCEEEIITHRINDSKLEEKKIFKDMYDMLQQKNGEYIEERTERLTDVLLKAIQIGKKFSSVLGFYVAANIFIIALGLNYYVTCVSLAVMGGCFLYKLVEFLSNKYCFIDAYLIMIYKSVLEKLAGHPMGE